MYPISNAVANAVANANTNANANANANASAHAAPMQYAAPTGSQNAALNGENGFAESRHADAYDGLLDRLNRMDRSASRRDLDSLDEQQFGALVEDIVDGERTCYQWVDSFHKFGFHSPEHWQTMPCPDAALPQKPTEPTLPTTTMSTTTVPRCVEEQVIIHSGSGKLGIGGWKEYRHVHIACDQLKAKQERNERNKDKCWPS